MEQTYSFTTATTNPSIGHEQIYYWVASANKLISYNEGDIKFDDLPFSEIYSFTLIPLKKYKDIYPPLRVSTNYQKFKYFRRIIFCGDMLETVFYVVISNGYYIIQYPQGKFYYFKTREEFDGFSWN